jgi:hypothetical protein
MHSQSLVSHSLQENTTAANGVAVNSILQQQQQQQQRRSWNGDRPQARPVTLSSSQVQGQGQEFSSRNTNNLFGGRSDTSKNLNSAAAPGSRMPQEFRRSGSERFQMAASNATSQLSQAGNTSIQRMFHQRRASIGGEVNCPQATSIPSAMRSHSLHGNTAAANGVAVNSDLKQQQQQRRSWKGATTVPIHNGQHQVYQPVPSTTIHLGPPSQRVQMAASSATSQAGNTRMQRMHGQRRASASGGGEVYCPEATSIPSAMRSHSLHGNTAAANGVVVNSVLKQQQQQDSQRRASGGGEVYCPQATSIPSAMRSHSLHGNTAAANGVVANSILKQQQQQDGQRRASASGGGEVYCPQATSTPSAMRNHSLHGNTAAANGVVVNSILKQQQQRQSWKGASTAPIHNGQHQVYPTVPSTTMPLEYGSPESERSIGGATQYSALRTPQFLQKQSALSVQGNTRTKRMHHQRRASSGCEVNCPQATRMPSIMDSHPMATVDMMVDDDDEPEPMQQSSKITQSHKPQGGGGHLRTPNAPMQPGLSRRGAGGAAYGRCHSMGMAGGQQQLVHATPAIQQMASRGASVCAAQQSQMFTESRPSSRPCNLQGQIQKHGQGSVQQVGVAHPVVREYKRGSFLNGRAAIGVLDRQYEGQSDPPVRTPSAPMQAPIQPGLSGRGAGGAAYGRRNSMVTAGGQQQVVHATPATQQTTSRGASVCASQQSQMFSESRPSSRPCNLQGQIQKHGQGSGQQAGVAHPVVRAYKCGSFVNGRAAIGVMDKQFDDPLEPQQRDLRADLYESNQQVQGEHLSKLTLESGVEGEYAAGYFHGLQQATNNSMSVYGANPAIKKEKASTSMASRIVKGLTGKRKSKTKKGVVGNNTNVGLQM